MTKVATAVVAWQQTAMRHRRGSAKWKRLQNKKEKVNNQPEVAVVAMVTAMVVAWRQTAMGHLRSSAKWKQLQKKTINRRWQRRWWHGGSVKWKRLQGKKSTGGGSGGGDMAAALNGSGCKKKD